MRLAIICKFQVRPSLLKCSEAFVSPQLGSDRKTSILISSPAIPVSLSLRDILGFIHKRVHLITQLKSPLEIRNMEKTRSQSNIILCHLQSSRHWTKNKLTNLSVWTMYTLPRTPTWNTQKRKVWRIPLLTALTNQLPRGVSQTYTNTDIIFCHLGTEYRSSDEMECGEGGVPENQPDLKPKDLLHSRLAPAGSRVKVCWERLEAPALFLSPEFQQTVYFHLTCSPDNMSPTAFGFS